MKSITAFMILFSSFFGLSEEYEKTKTEITQAVEQRNFQKVKVLLTDLMPLIKENIKKDKKSFQELKKSESKETLTLLEEKINQKSEIYDKFSHILKVSPAAVRGRSSQILALLDQYGEIMNK